MTIKKLQMPADNERFGARGAVTRRKCRANTNVARNTCSVSRRCAKSPGRWAQASRAL